MTIEITKEKRKEVIASIQRYFEENKEERIGNIAAGALLDFLLEELGPIVYNKAVSDVQERLQSRVMEVDIEVHEDEFQYWSKYDRQRKSKWASLNTGLRTPSLMTSDPMPMKTSNANYGNKKRGESNPSFQQTPSFTTWAP